MSTICWQSKADQMCSLFWYHTRKARGSRGHLGLNCAEDLSVGLPRPELYSCDIPITVSIRNHSSNTFIFTILYDFRFALLIHNAFPPICVCRMFADFGGLLMLNFVRMSRILWKISNNWMGNLVMKLAPARHNGFPENPKIRISEQRTDGIFQCDMPTQK